MLYINNNISVKAIQQVDHDRLNGKQERTNVEDMSVKEMQGTERIQDTTDSDKKDSKFDDKLLLGLNIQNGIHNVTRKVIP